MLTKLIYFLYRVLFALASPFIVLYVVRRSFRDRRYLAGLPERLGFLPGCLYRTAPGSIWLHAVSVGEVISSIRLLKEIRASRPEAPLFVSVTTLAGRALADEKLQGLADGVFFVPLDACSVVRRVLRILRPALVIILETEIWPNLYRETKRAGCGLLVINGRISDRAFPRYRSLRWFFRHVLLWPDAILAQSEISARRYLEMGAPPERVRTIGNLKYDFDVTGVAPPAPVRTLLDRLRPASVWVAASTMPPAHTGDIDEDDAVIEAFLELSARHPGLLLILVPRRPERFDSAAEKLERAGVGYIRRSRLTEDSTLPLPGVLLLDSMGELAGLFPLADVVFMGGTFPQRGGHNILEPAFFARPVLIGPHMENFPEIAGEFRAAGAVAEIEAPGGLAPAVEVLLNDAARRAAIGERAKRLAEARRGATARALQEIGDAHGRAVPRFRPYLPLWLTLWPVSKLWTAGTALHRGLSRPRSLQTPVISVGGLAMGGTGKTPVVLYLAGRLPSPAILTRGYGRRSSSDSLVLPPGIPAPVSETGDEAQIFLRAGLAFVGVGANRYQTGAALERDHAPSVFLLDDGFQHWPLARDLDIVLIDALDPWAGGGVFPIGRLREPPQALARAGAILLTRTIKGRGYEGLVSWVRRYNSRAPVFLTRVKPRRWLDAATGQPAEPGVSAAFCGLGNPASFWQTLDHMGCAALWRETFPDHHAYSSEELRSLASRARAAGADTLLTTHKDVMNLPEGAAALLAPLRLLWLEIEVEIDGEEEFLALVRQTRSAARSPDRAAAS